MALDLLGRFQCNGLEILRVRYYFLAAITATSLASSILIPTTARADLTGDTVDLTYYYPDSASVYAELGTQTVPAAAYDLSSTTGPGMTITVTGTQIILTDNWYVDTYLPLATFDGWVLTDLTSSDITDVTVDSELNIDFSSASISWTPNSISVNWGGVDFAAGGYDSNVVLDVSTTVPEPASLGLLGTGLLVLVSSVRRRA